MTARRALAPYAVGDADAGFTVVEMMIALFVSSVVIVSILGFLTGQMSIERRVDAFASNQEELRQTLVALQRDLRSSAPPAPLATTTDYQYRLQLDVFGDISSPGVPVAWYVNGAAELVREDQSTAPPTITHRLRGVDATLPLFTYYRANGQPFVLDASTQPADVAACTTRIGIRLVAAPRPGPRPAPLHSDVQLRNRSTKPQGCPLSPAPVAVSIPATTTTTLLDLTTTTTTIVPPTLPPAPTVPSP